MLIGITDLDHAKLKHPWFGTNPTFPTKKASE
jgi:hypothetical protein